MTPSISTKQAKTYALGYEVFDVSPLSHYFEEIYGHIKGIAEVGPRGDRNYFWYSKNRKGGAYYEIKEQQLSAKSTYEQFCDISAREKYYSDIDALLNRVAERLKSAEITKPESLTDTELLVHVCALFNLDAEVFSYYLVSQPYRLKLFEDEVRWELQKRVAKVTIDDYLARLVASSEMTDNAKEELAWSSLIIAAKEELGSSTDRKSIVRNDTIRNALLNHFEMFKLLNLGDGKWSVDFESEVKRFIQDCKNPIEHFREQAARINKHSEKVAKEHTELIEVLKLQDSTVNTVEYLSKMSHLRYTIRVRGFVPVIYYLIQATDELARRLGYGNNVNFNYMTLQEYEETIEKGKRTVPLSELKKRRGKQDEYMLRLNDGKVEYYFGKEAGDLFARLVPPIDHSTRTELTGVSAQSGHVSARATVYSWGDDMEEAIRQISSNPILIAGQTRPAMMPLIRLAKGIVTDEGGVTSHAAIVARELGIPTVINTVVATKVFSTGDYVELDANNGKVRKGDRG